MVKEAPRSEVMGVRLSEKDRARLEFWAEQQKRRPATIASELLSQAVAAALHADTAPRPVVYLDEGEADPVSTVSA